MKRILGVVLLSLSLLAPAPPVRAADEPVITSVPYSGSVDLSGAHNGGGDSCVSPNHAVTAGGSLSRTLRVGSPVAVEFTVRSQTTRDLSVVLLDPSGHQISCGARTAVRPGQDYRFIVTWYAEAADQGPSDAFLELRRSDPVGIGVVRQGRWYLATRPGASASRSFTLGTATDSVGFVGRTPYFRRGTSWYPYAQHPFSYGGADALPVTGDWDGRVDTLFYGAGLADDPRPGVVRDGLWAVNGAPYPSTPAQPTKRFSFGSPGDVFLVGDWDGDGRSTPAVYRKGRWFFSNSLGGPATSACSFGGPTDVPVVGDWDADGVDSPGLFRDGRWFLVDRCGGHIDVVTFGGPGDRPVVGHWT